MIAELAAHLWQSTVFALAAGLLTIAFRGNRAKVRFALWLSASLKFYLPFSLLLGLGGRFAWAPAVQSIATPEISFAIERIAAPFPSRCHSRRPRPVPSIGYPRRCLLCGHADSWQPQRCAFEVGGACTRRSAPVRRSIFPRRSRFAHRPDCSNPAWPD
jgi:hypothetical protein